MKLKQGFITQDYHGEQLMVAVGDEAKRFHGIARSNGTAAFIVNQLKHETTEDGIVAALLDEYEVEEDRARSDVRRILSELRTIGAIEEETGKC